MDKLRQLQFLLTKIPKGKVSTYGILGRKMSIHPRTVGILLRKNPYPNLYPCYKIVHSDGRIGGYARGVKEKVRRLRKDGITIEKDRVSKTFFFYF